MTLFELEKCNGPACPRCGCCDAEIIALPDPEKSTWYGAGRAQCKHCRLIYHFKELPQDCDKKPEANGAVFASDVCCPSCKSQDVIVTSTRAKVRHHKCRDCNKNFKTPRPL